jgi:hypothetical protein
LRDPVTGRLVDSRHTPNTVVDGGEILIAELLANSQEGVAPHAPGASAPNSTLKKGLTTIAVGTLDTAVNQADHTLKATTTITGNAYKQIDLVDVGNTGGNNVITLEGTFNTSNGNGALKEAGVFAGETSGGLGYVTVVGEDGVDEPANNLDDDVRMFNRVTFGVITKTSSFSLTLKWTITIGSIP